MQIFNRLSAFPITPADPSGRVNETDLRSLLAPLRQAGVDSIGLLGSTGTYAYLSRDQRRRVLEISVDEIKKSTPLIAGIGALRTDEVVALAKDADALGVDGLLLAPMSYTPLSDEEVLAHYRSVVEATDLPLCIYNNPGTTHFTFSKRLIAQLAEIPSVTAIKMPLPATSNVQAELDAMRGELPANFLIGYSGDWGCGDALLSGANTWFSVVAGILPVQSMRLTNAAVNGDQHSVAELNAKFKPLWDLFQEFGSLRVVYAIANSLGVTNCLPPRPILPLPEADRKRVASALESLDMVG